MMQQREKGDPVFRMSEGRGFEGLSRRAKERLLGGVAAVSRAKPELCLEDETGCRVQEIMPGGAVEWHLGGEAAGHGTTGQPHGITETAQTTTGKPRRATEAVQTTTRQPRRAIEAAQTTTGRPRRATEATLDTTFPPRHSAEAGRKVKQEPRRAPHSHPAETENHRG